MKYLLLSDIHANHVALEAVLAHAQARPWDACIFLGDLVGYYPEPEQTAQMLRQLKPQTCILGNHDAMLLDLAQDKPLDPSQGNAVVQAILKRHLDAISDETLAWLGQFERKAVFDSFEVTHGALREPWVYITSATEAKRNYTHMSTPLCFFGHSHIPGAFVRAAHIGFWRAVPFRSEYASYPVPENASVFFNPGSVGQPRDGIPLASYAIFDADSRTVELFRVPFAIDAMHRLVAERDYPRALATRLEQGR